MGRPDHLKTLAFRIDPQYAILPYVAYTLTIPEHWRSALYDLQKMRTRRNQEYCTIPHRQLSDLLRALLPDLIFVDSNNKAWKSGEASPWLYAQEPTDAEALYLIVRAWAQTEFSDVPEPMRNTALSDLRATDLCWRKQSYDLAAWGTAANGTATPGFPDAFRFLPNLLAAKFSKPGVELQIGNEPLRFRRALLDPGASGIELISWPPRRYITRGKTWPYSLVLTLTVQTVPFQPYPLIYCNISKRRWAGPTMKHKSLPGGNTSVYLLTEVPWITDIQSYHSFQVAPIRWKRLLGAEQKPGQPTFQVVWANKLAQLLDRLRPNHLLPDPQIIMDDPLLSMSIGGSLSTAIVFRNSMEPQHASGTGIPPADRKVLAEQIAQILEPEVVQAEPLHRIGIPSGRSIKANANKNRRLMQCCVGEHVKIEIRYQTNAVRDALTKAVEIYFGLEQGTKFPFHCPDTGLTIHLDVEPLGEIGSRLELLDSGTKKARFHAAIKQRCVHVAEQIASASMPTGTLIELHSREDFNRGAEKSVRGLIDPYPALRKAFAHVQRLTQFINTPTEENDTLLEHRATNSVRDLIRQLGVQDTLPSLPTSEGSSIGYVGVWLVKEYANSSATRVHQKLLVMVRVDSDTGLVMAIAGNMDHWLPYREMLLKVGRGEVAGVAKDKEALPFVQKIVSRDLKGDTLLLCHAQNLRATWPWLANAKIAVDRFAFLENEALQPISTRPGLRIIRVRDSDANETPQWYAPYEDGTVTYTKGLFAAGERVFMGLNDKGSKNQRSRYLSVLQEYTNREGTSHGPAVKEYTPSQSLCEITTACLQAGDEPADWAALTNNLRDAATHYGEATALPLPLHLAKLVKEYVLPVAVEEEDEQA
jgi:hypothetical protein